MSGVYFRMGEVDLSWSHRIVHKANALSIEPDLKSMGITIVGNFGLHRVNLLP